MKRVYAPGDTERRKMSILYAQSGIKNRYSVLSDYSKEPGEWTFYPATENLEPFPSLEERMKRYNAFAPELSAMAIRKCLGNRSTKTITHLITVTCTGLSAPGLDLQLLELLQLEPDLFRTSVNFMGCYAAIHALKMADAFCRSDPDAVVMIVCTELCTLHFQQAPTSDNITSSLLFGDGSAAVMVTGKNEPTPGLSLRGFHSEVKVQGKSAMSWELSSTGFAMTLDSYVPELIRQDFGALAAKAFGKLGIDRTGITDWCIHPGGRKILEAIQEGLTLPKSALEDAYAVLSDYGNMSSPTVLFVLDRLWKRRQQDGPQVIFGAAFGPGLTMETFVAGQE